MLIRDFASGDDLHLIANWWATEWSTPDAAPKMFEFLISGLRDGKIHNLKVAVSDSGALVGCASLQERDMGQAHPEYSPWLAGVFVLPAYRGKKLGELLSTAVVDSASERGFKKIYLFTDKMSVWYESLGWSVIGEEVYKEKFVTVMSREC